MGYCNLIHLSEFLPNSIKIRQKFIDENYFQTKSLDNTLTGYTLEDDGKLYITYEGFNFDAREENAKLHTFCPWTGEIIFYTSYTVKREWWVDLILKVKDGEFDIKKIKFFKNLMF